MATQSETVTGEGATPPQTGRLRALDGLRGLAALSVLIGHIFWVTPQFAEAVQLKNAGQADPWTSALTYTPLHLAWLSREAVIVFFVLSGFVLTRPFLARRSGYLAYYPSRIARLLIPAWAALLLAAGIAFTFFPREGDAVSLLLDSQVNPSLPLGQVLGEWLIAGAPQVLLPLWSLKWEVAFSLLLPVYVVVARWAVGAWKAPLVAMTCVGVSAVGTYIGDDRMEFLPTFMLGCLVASNADQLTRFLKGSRATSAGVLGLVALCAGWYSRGVSDSVALTGIGQTVSVAGAGLVVLSALTWQGFATLLSRGGAMRWLGERSFSLYLVHFPIVMASAFLSWGENFWLTLAISLPASAITAEIFYRLIEKPSMRVSRAIKRQVARSRP